MLSVFANRPVLHSSHGFFAHMDKVVLRSRKITCKQSFAVFLDNIFIAKRSKEKNAICKIAYII